MSTCDTLIRNARVIDGSGDGLNDTRLFDVAIKDGMIEDIAPKLVRESASIHNAGGKVLSPGFIDAHTHDDMSVIHHPEMLPKLSQGVTTVIVGNCGISAAPVRMTGRLPDPMNLLGGPAGFRYPTFSSYVSAVGEARPAVNVAALVGHTSLRNNHMDRLDRAAHPRELSGMLNDLRDALRHGAIGLSSGLAYLSANSASAEEVGALAKCLQAFDAIYATHLRSEAETILDALQEAFDIGREARTEVIVSHIKCAGIANWGRSEEVLSFLRNAQARQSIACDCYPYAAGSSTLDLRQVDERVKITITWSDPHPEVAGKTLEDISHTWNMRQLEVAKQLQPAGAIYHSIHEEDMRRFLQNSTTMIGSDGLPNDPMPHPRLWGTFPRVLGKYCREEKLFSLDEAIYKMTGLPAKRFHLYKRGLIRPGFYADLVLFDPDFIGDTATFAQPISQAKGIEAVWVHGVLSHAGDSPTGQRAGRFLAHHQQSL